MNRSVLFSLGIALILFCQGLMNSEDADRSPPDDLDEEDDFVKWMFIYCPIMITSFSILLTICAYTQELNMALHLVPLLFLLIVTSILQYLIQFVLTNYTAKFRTACSYVLAGIMGVVAVVTPFYASWAASTGWCAQRVRQQPRDYNVYTLPDIALGDLTTQEGVSSLPGRVRLTQTYSASRSSSSFDPSSPEREVQVDIHPVPVSPDRQSAKTFSTARRALSPTPSPFSGSINVACSPKSGSYAPLGTASTASSHNSELTIEPVPACSDDCSPIAPVTLKVQTRRTMKRPLESDEDEHEV